MQTTVQDDRTGTGERLAVVVTRREEWEQPFEVRILPAVPPERDKFSAGARRADGRRGVPTGHSVLRGEHPLLAESSEVSLPQN